MLDHFPTENMTHELLVILVTRGQTHWLAVPEVQGSIIRQGTIIKGIKQKSPNRFT